MNKRQHDPVSERISGRLSAWFPIIGLLIGGAALWYTWMEWNHPASTTGLSMYWYAWGRPALFALTGVFCLAGSVMLLAGSRRGKTVLTSGLMIIPVVLFINLIVALVRLAAALVQGQAGPWFSQLLSNPKSLIVPVVIVALILLGSLSKVEGRKN